MDRVDILNLINEYKVTFLPSGWEWRPHQMETIEAIIRTYLNGETSYIVCECPTGSGKSHIALCVSYVLNKMKKRGFILTSDVSLQNQYEYDLKQSLLPWGSVKGVDRYKCTENDEVCSIGTCRITRKNPRDMSCYEECPYFMARDKASASDTSILNYSYWLVQMNERQNPEDGAVYFPKRDFVICDEAHKITDIVQSHFAPRLSLDSLDRFTEMCEFLNNYNILNVYNKSFDKIKLIFKALFKYDDVNSIYGLLTEMVNEMDSIVRCAELVMDKSKMLYPTGKLPTDWNKMFRHLTFFISLKDTIKTYISLVEKGGINGVIKNITSEKDLTLNYLYTNFMVEHFFHEYVGFGVFLSATIGDAQEYFADMQLNNGIFYKIGSTFDFTKSPIHYYNAKRMSYNKMEDNIPWLIDKVNTIIEENEGTKGMIHSGSYDLALKIFNGLSSKNRDRVLIYSGTDEKDECINQLKLSRDKIIIGPSLIEGVNLPGEHCRFLVFAKVPYLSLSDAYVKARMQVSHKWYQSKAIINILQGVGRGVRNEVDWCRTYILDANFGDLFSRNRSAFPDEFKRRIILHKD